MLCFFIDAASTREPVLLLENKAEHEEDTETVILSPKSSLNLAGLKAAFSSHYSSSSGKSSKEKASSSGTTQKTLQSFFKDPVKPSSCSPSLKSPSKPTSELVKGSPGKSVLDRFRYGMMPCEDMDSPEDSAGFTCDIPEDKPNIQCFDPELNSPKADDGSVNNKTAKESSGSSQTVPKDPELQTETCTPYEDSAVSPEAKRARKDHPHSPPEQESSAFSNCGEKCSSTVDAPVGLHRRTVQLHFSLAELAEKMRRLQDLQKLGVGDELRYRRFRAKIKPGENQSAEDELKKEIR